MIDLFSPRNAMPMIFQTQISECGLACLAMIASHHGKASDIRSLRDNLRMPTNGASVKQLLNAAGKIDLQGRALKLELRDVNRLTLPAVLHWDTDHFVVLKKVNRRSVIVHDPAVGMRSYSIKELDIHFTGIAIELSPAVSFKQEKQLRQYSLTQLLKATPSFKQAIRQVFCLSLLLQLLSLISPLYLQLVIDQGLSKGDMDIIFFVAMLFVLVILGRAIVGYFRGLVLLQFSSQLGFQMVSNTFSHLLKLPLRFFERREMGDIVSRFSSLENIKQLVTQEMITVIVDGLFSLLTFFLLFLYSSTLALVAVISVAVFAIIRFVSLSVEKSHRQEVLQTNAKQQTRFMENIRSIAVTKNYGIEGERLSDWQNHYANYINRSYGLGKFQLSISSLQNLIFGLDHIATIYLGSAFIYAGQLTIGQLMSFIFLKQHFSSSISAMLPKLAEIRLMKLELERVSDIVFEQAEDQASECSLLERSLAGRVEAKQLFFGYSAGQPSLIENLCFKVDAGGFLAITGASGCGKSTLLKLLLGLDSPTRGSVLIDGMILHELGLKHYRSQISAVLHRDDLLAGSLAYNINLDQDVSNFERLKSACHQACIYDDICTLPMGFNTQVGELGVALSAGQVQRILLARSLYRLPKILILDEALSHLSAEVAHRIITNIQQLNITLILVTHNPQLLTLAGQYVKLENRNVR